MVVKCHHCKKRVEISIGQYNYRVKKHGLNVYCDRICSGKGRRHNRSRQEEKAVKYFYDALIRLDDDGRLKKQRHEYFLKDYHDNPEKYRRARKKRQKEHNEYCRKPEYRKYKKEYDKKRVAKKNYGEFWEASIALRRLGDVVDNRQAKQDQKSINKTQKRKRYANKNTKRKELESCVMGLYQPG